MLKMAKTKFREIYDSLPARAGKAPKTVWIERLAKICMVSEQTVRCWVYGTQKPDALKLSIISKELGVPADELFS
jgi:transcriptional regulator with XRE-family HTH domain